MNRVFKLSAISAIVLFVTGSINILSAKAAAAPVGCQSYAAFFKVLESAPRTNFLIWDGLYVLQPGEKLIFTLTPGSTAKVDIGTTDFKGTYSTSQTTQLPVSINYGSLAKDEIWGVEPTSGNFFVSVKCIELTATSAAACPIFFDGRLNDCDAGETVAIYCEADGSINVLAIWMSQGYAAIVASPVEIAKVPKNPTVNTAIKSGNGATLYRLTSGELQVNRAENDTGKMYHFIFNDCPKP